MLQHEIFYSILWGLLQSIRLGLGLWLNYRSDKWGDELTKILPIFNRTIQSETE